MHVNSGVHAMYMEVKGQPLLLVLALHLCEERVSLPTAYTIAVE